MTQPAPDPRTASTLGIPIAEWIRSAALIALIAMGTVLCLLLTRPFLPALAWASALAIVMMPVYRSLRHRLHSANLAAGAAVALLALVLLGVVGAVLPGLIQTSIAGVMAIQTHFESGRLDTLVQDHPWLDSVWQWTKARVDLPAAVQNMVGGVTALASSVFQGSVFGAVQLGLVHFFLYYLLRDQSTVLPWLKSILPLNSSEFVTVSSWVNDTVYATLCGTMLVGLVQGFLGGLMFWWLGLDAPMFWALVMGVLTILPVVGPSLVWGPAAIILALGNHWGQAFVLVAWGGIVIGLVGSLLYPILLGRRLRLHTVAVFMAMVGGIFLFGSCGFFLGPVVLAVTLALFGIWNERARAQPNDGADRPGEVTPDTGSGRPKSLFENSEGSCFRGKGRLARRDEGAYPPGVCD